MSGCGTVLIPSSWYFIDLCLEEERSIQSVWSDNGANFEPGASHMGGVWECKIRSARAILEGLLKTHSHSMNDELLRTLMVEVELIINSRSLTVETISDSKSEIPLSRNNLLTMKMSVGLSSPGEFSKPDAYSRDVDVYIAG